MAGVGREEAFSAWRRYLEALAAERPTVLVLEDLHWADAALLDFVEHLLDWTADAPLMVVATARPELYDMRPGWGGGRRNSATLGLSPLSDEDTARLVSSLLERSVMPAETQAALLERAGGNPLYAEQFVRMLGESGASPARDLPETVQALIAARLDTLAPELKSLLQDASVLGKVFWTGALAAMGARERDDVLSGLRELVRREFVRPARVSSMRDEEEFSFWHVLVRDVAYQQIPRAARARSTSRPPSGSSGSRRGASPITRSSSPTTTRRRSSSDARRVTSVTRTTCERQLVRFSVLAGDRAMSLDIPAAASGVSARARRRSDPVRPRATVLVKLGDALQPLGQLSESEAAYEEAIPTLSGRRRGSCGRARDVESRPRSLASRRHGARSRGWTRGSRAARGRPEPELVLAYGRMAALDALGGRPEQAIEWADKGIELAGEIGVANVVRPLSGCAGSHGSTSAIAAGSTTCARLSSSALELGLPAEDTAIAYGNLGEQVEPRRSRSRTRAGGSRARVRAKPGPRAPRDVLAQAPAAIPVPRGALGRRASPRRTS